MRPGRETGQHILVECMPTTPFFDTIEIKFIPKRGIKIRAVGYPASEYFIGEAALDDPLSLGRTISHVCGVAQALVAKGVMPTGASVPTSERPMRIGEAAKILGLKPYELRYLLKIGVVNCHKEYRKGKKNGERKLTMDDISEALKILNGAKEEREIGQREHHSLTKSAAVRRDDASVEWK